MAEVRVYTTPFCGFCRAATRLLRRKGVDFDQINVAGDRDKRRWLVEATGRTSVPQVFVDGVSYGGFTDLLELDEKGELDVVLGLTDPAP